VMAPVFEKVLFACRTAKAVVNNMIAAAATAMPVIVVFCIAMSFHRTQSDFVSRNKPYCLMEQHKYTRPKKRKIAKKHAPLAAVIPIIRLEKTEACVRSVS
jgi:hypothetical protein